MLVLSHGLQNLLNQKKLLPLSKKHSKEEELSLSFKKVRIFMMNWLNNLKQRFFGSKLYQEELEKLEGSLDSRSY